MEGNPYNLCTQQPPAMISPIEQDEPPKTRVYIPLSKMLSCEISDAEYRKLSAKVATFVV